MILAIDGTNWIHTLWHAQPGSACLDTFLRRGRALVAHLKPSHIVACFDRRSFRHELFAGYKSARPEKSDGLIEVLKEVEVAATDFAQILTQDGFEADDGLASLAECGRQIGQQTVLASPDKDLRQSLVAGQVTILRSFKLDFGKVVDAEYFTAATLDEKYGLRPEQWPSYQALCGDSGDGIAGCPGWGEKTTIAALKVQGTLAGCLANPWALPISAKQRNSLLTFRMAAAELTLRLVTLRTDMEAAWDALR